jgi:hypothetical protein
MTVEEYTRKVDNALKEVRSEHPEINARLSLSALNLIRSRITNKGVDHNGKSFGKYSTNKLPYFFFQDKGLGSGADKKLAAKKKKDKEGISYEEWRKLNGLQTKHVDMQFTKETFNDFAVLETRNNGDDTVLTIVASKGSINKGNGINTKDVSEFLADRYGDYLSISQEETDILRKALDDEIQLILDRI